MTSTGSAPWQPPGAAAVGDYNGDGKLDAVIGDGTGAIRVLLGNGNGTFSRRDVAVGAITTSNAFDLNPGFAPYLPHAVDGVGGGKAADLNGDGKPDLIFPMGVHLNFAPLNGVTVMINAGNDGYGTPQFTTAHYFLPFSDIRSMTAGDLNGDGRTDFIVGGAYGQLQVYLSNGDGTLTRGQQYALRDPSGNPVGGAVAGGAIGDVNGDGKADFIVTSNQGGATNIFLGNGDGTLQVPATIPNLAINVAIADMNNDGKPDLVEGFGDGSVSVALNNGNGTFGAATSFPTVANGGVSGFFIADVNGDGNRDVAVSLSSAGQVAILTGNGAGALSSPYLYGGIPQALGVALVDFTGDGKPEIAATSPNGYGGQNYAVLTNTTVYAPPLPTQTLTILGGYGNVGGVAANVEYYNPATSNWQPAYLCYFPNNPGGHPWGNITGTNNWINYRANGLSDPGAGPTTNQTLWYLYRVRFTVPADAVNPKMTFSVKADNFVQVAINGTATGGSTQYLNNTYVNNVIVGQANQLNADAVFSQSVHPGENTITLNVGDWGGLNGFNFRIDLSMQSSQPVDIVPVSADTTPPVITAPVSITKEATGPGGATATFTVTAVDAIDGPVSVLATPSSGSLFPLGTTTVQLKATDSAGNTAVGSFPVKVQDTTPPTITQVSGNLTVEATSAAGATVNYLAAQATDLVTANPTITYSKASGTVFPLGTTTVTVTATDAAGNQKSAAFSVTVQDTTAPTITSVTPSTGSLWPANHKMVAITLNAVAADAVGVTSLKIVGVTSSEPDNGLGDGDTANDIQVTGDLTLNLRAERSGTGSGRTYTITVEAKDAAGNTSTKTCTVSVPKSQGGK